MTPRLGIARYSLSGMRAPWTQPRHGNGAEFVGSLADLRIFDAELSPADVRALAVEPML